jgi:hypothetical protein
MLATINEQKSLQALKKKFLLKNEIWTEHLDIDLIVIMSNFRYIKFILGRTNDSKCIC